MARLDVKVYNKETGAWDDLDLTAKYNLAGYNYTLRDLGDGFSMFDGAVNVLDYVMEDYMVLANYVQGFEGGVVEATNSPLAAKYPGFTVDYCTVDGSGRIVMEAAVREPEAVETTAPATQAPETTAETFAVEEIVTETSSSSSIIAIAVISCAALAVVVFVLKKKEQ